MLQMSIKTETMYDHTNYRHLRQLCTAVDCCQTTFDSSIQVSVCRTGFRHTYSEDRVCRYLVRPFGNCWPRKSVIKHKCCKHAQQICMNLENGCSTELFWDAPSPWLSALDMKHNALQGDHGCIVVHKKNTGQILKNCRTHTGQLIHD